MAETYTTYYHSPVGWLKLTGTGTCIRELLFLNVPPPAPATTDIPPLLLQCLDQLIEYFQGARKEFELPLDQIGTAYQQAVWNELIKIPFGKTISYLDLARRMGDINATRAVANANGRNNISIIVPCHRVIGADRSLTGYAGGLWRKKWLLDHEVRLTYGVQTLF